MRNFTLSFILIFVSRSVFSLEPIDSLGKDLKEVTISATRLERNLIETGRSVTVLTQKDLDNSVYSTVAELLSNQEGLYIVGSNQTPGSVESIFMRGANSNQTAIFVDGIRINDGSSVNNTIDLGELPLADVERIEILRGSQSTLYGTSAIGGVINISTFKPEKTGTSLKIGLSGGSFDKSGNQIFPFANIGYKLKNGIYFSTGGSYQQVNGIDATIDTVTNPLVFKHRDRDNWIKKSGGLELGFISKKTDVSFGFKHLHMNTDIDKSAFVDDDNYTLNYERNTAYGKVRYFTNDKLDIALTCGFTKNVRHAYNDSSLVDNSGSTDKTISEDQYSSQNNSADLFATWKEKNIHYSLGASYLNEKMDQVSNYYSALYGFPAFESHSSLDTIHPDASTTSLYAQLDLHGALISPFFTPFEIILGARMMNHSKFGQEFVWELNPSWRITNEALMYFSFSKGLNAPSLYQLYSPSRYFTYDMNFTTGIPTGNADLLPEISDSYELGFKQKISTTGFFGLSIFKSITKNQIDYVYFWDQNVPIDQLGTDFNRDDYRGDRYLNTGKQTMYGIEFTFENKINDFLQLRFNLGLVNGYIDYSSSQISNSQTGGNHVQIFNNGSFLNAPVRTQGLTRRPNTARTEIQVTPVKNFDFILGLSYVGSRSDVYYDATRGPFGALSTTPVNDYTLVDISCHYPVTSHLSASFRLENLLNEKYSEIKGFTSRGRGAYLKITYEL